MTMEGSPRVDCPVDGIQESTSFGGNFGSITITGSNSLLVCGVCGESRPAVPGTYTSKPESTPFYVDDFAPKPRRAGLFLTNWTLEKMATK